MLVTPGFISPAQPGFWTSCLVNKHQLLNASQIPQTEHVQIKLFSFPQRCFSDGDIGRGSPRGSPLTHPVPMDRETMCIHMGTEVGGELLNQ